MRQMKDSGIEWIGQIPAEWEVRKIGNIFQQRLEKGSESNILLAATQQYGIIPQSKIEGVVKVKENTDLQSFKTVKTNDYVISLRSFQGGIEYSQYEGVCSPAYQVFYSNIKINYIFFKYLFKSESFISKINSLTVGIRDGKNIQYAELKTVSIPFPPLNEQQRIADYLDAQCARIDETMELVRQSREKLRAYKLSLITEAVTKGLDPDVPMKDSGVPWIGEIPAGWETRRLKYTLRCPLQYGANASGVPYDSNLPRYIRITDIDDNGMLKSENKQSLYEEDAFGYILDEGDILLARSGATVGKSFLYEEKFGRAAFAGYLIRAKMENEILNNYFFYYITQSHLYNEWKNSIFIQSTIQNIGAERYANLVFPLPPLPEQQRIAAYLDDKCARIDDLLAEKDALLDKLAEYRKSLIFECVTGKREVTA